MLKSIGPNIDPCVTPLSTQIHSCQHDDNLILIPHTNCVNSQNSGSISYAQSLIFTLFTESNAFFISMKMTIPFTLPFINILSSWLNKISLCKSQDLCFTKPYCELLFLAHFLK